MSRSGGCVEGLLIKIPGDGQVTSRHGLDWSGPGLILGRVHLHFCDICFSGGERKVRKGREEKWKRGTEGWGSVRGDPFFTLLLTKTFIWGFTLPFPSIGCRSRRSVGLWGKRTRSLGEDLEASSTLQWRDETLVQILNVEDTPSAHPRDWGGPDLTDLNQKSGVHPWTYILGWRKEWRRGGGRRPVWSEPGEQDQ